MVREAAQSHSPVKLGDSGPKAVGYDNSGDVGLRRKCRAYGSRALSIEHGRARMPESTKPHSSLAPLFSPSVGSCVRSTEKLSTIETDLVILV
jgi:hypothetical protein